MSIVVTLHGGTNHGAHVEIHHRGLPTILMHKRMPLSAIPLPIDETATQSVGWRDPDEVYELQRDGTYVFVREIVYGPPSAVIADQDRRWAAGAQPKEMP